MATQATRIQPKRQSAALSADRILNSSSPIGKPETDLQPFFYTCIKDWDTNYSEEEKQQIIAKLPKQYRKIEKDHNGNIICPLSLDFAANDQFFRDSMARFQRDVSDGFWTATWRNNAMKASEERSRGKFDDFLQQNAEDMFGNNPANMPVHDEGGETSDGEFKSTAARNKKTRGKAKRQHDRSINNNRRMAAEMEDMGDDELHG